MGVEPNHILPQESLALYKLLKLSDMNNNFRIQFEESELQREELLCSSCLSTHHDILYVNPSSLYFLWLGSFGLV